MCSNSNNGVDVGHSPDFGHVDDKFLGVAGVLPAAVHRASVEMESDGAIFAFDGDVPATKNTVARSVAFYCERSAGRLSCPGLPQDGGGNPAGPVARRKHQGKTAILGRSAAFDRIRRKGIDVGRGLPIGRRDVRGPGKHARQKFGNVFIARYFLCGRFPMRFTCGGIIYANNSIN